jgi:hypothetical protein
MDFRVRSDDPILSAALDQLKERLEKRDDRKYTLGQAVQIYLRERLVLMEGSRDARLADRLDDLQALLGEHLSAENVLIYTLINGVAPKTFEGINYGKKIN